MAAFGWKHALVTEHQPSKKPPHLLEDIRLIFATILTDPGSSLAYGADALIAVTVVLLATPETYRTGVVATCVGGGVIMLVYLLAILVYNGMTRHHTHRVLGGGAFVSALITAEHVRTPIFQKVLRLMGKGGTASLLADFPATQAISLIAGVEALYFLPGHKLYWAFAFMGLLSFVQRYGLGNLARYMIWPVLAFYVSNICINATGIATIATQGWKPPTILGQTPDASALLFLPILQKAIANGSTLITGVEVGYSSVNIPHHRGRAIRISMWLLYGIVVVTYAMQLVNFLGLGVVYDLNHHIPVPLQIARALGGDALAQPFGILTAMMLLLAAQTAQTDFPLEMLRASRSNFFPKAIGDTAWRRTRPTPVIGGHGVYNPRATVLLGILSGTILVFFPSSHAIESMYGLAVLAAMNIDISSYLLRQIRLKKWSVLTMLGLVVMFLMLGNILVNKFFEGAWFIVVLMFLYMIVFLVSEEIYSIWNEKLKVAPLEVALWYPAFQGLPVDRSNIILVSKFHPGIVHFLKNYIRSGKIPLAVHFQTDPNEVIPDDPPPWFENVVVPQGTDTISAIKDYIERERPSRVHLIPILVRGVEAIKDYYFSNSIQALTHTLSEFSDLQVEYNRERVVISKRELLRRVLRFWQ